MSRFAAGALTPHANTAVALAFHARAARAEATHAVAAAALAFHANAAGICLATHPSPLALWPCDRGRWCSRLREQVAAKAVAPTTCSLHRVVAMPTIARVVEDIRTLVVQE